MFEKATTGTETENTPTFSIPLSVSPSVSQTLNRLCFSNFGKYSKSSEKQPVNIEQKTPQPIQMGQQRVSEHASSLSLLDQINLFSAWKTKVDQFKLLMQIKHNNFGFTWYLFN